MSRPWSEVWGREAASVWLGPESEDRRDLLRQRPDRARRRGCLRDRGVRVPDDIAVVGFDNWQIIAAATRPPLTTIDMNLHELGRQAGLRLLDMIDGEAAATRRPALALQSGGARVVRSGPGAPNVFQEHHDGAFAA